MVALGSSTLPNKLSIIFLGVRPLTKTSSDTSPAILFRGKYSLFQSLTAMSFKDILFNNKSYITGSSKDKSFIKPFF